MQQITRTIKTCCLCLHFITLNLVCLQKQYFKPVAHIRTLDAEDVLESLTSHDLVEIRKQCALFSEAAEEL